MHNFLKNMLTTADKNKQLLESTMFFNEATFHISWEGHVNLV